MLLDSTFINDLVRGESVATEKLEALIQAETAVRLSSLTVFEVGMGLRGEAERHRERFDAVVEDIEVVPFSAGAARCATAIQHVLVDRGERIGEIDVLIAGTVVEAGENVLTRNVEEFRRVHDLGVETY